MSSPAGWPGRAGTRPGKSGQTRLARAWNPAGPARQNDRMPAPDDTALDSATASSPATRGPAVPDPAGPDPAANHPGADGTGDDGAAGGGTAGGGTGADTDIPDITGLRDSCTRFLHGHGPVRAADLLATIPPDTVPDRYGDGGAVAELEAEIKLVLGKPAAVFLPSGTMAQQSVLRVHADHQASRTVVFHPACHLDQHEGRGYERLHQLTGRPAGKAHRLLSLDDLRGIAEPIAALLIELPQRDLGGQQPSWADLVAQAQWARERGAAVHLDGARLWESAAGYQQPPEAVASLFDTVYVSFYKGLGALPGCCVAGPEDVIAEVREWRHRMGGRLYGLWPNAASALTCLTRRLPLMPRYLSHARAIADVLRDLPGVRVIPDPPQSPMMHMLLATSLASFTAAAGRLATECGVWTWPTAMRTGDPGSLRVELAVGDGTLALRPAEVRELIAALVAG
jgi:threonine aldolase